MFDFATQVNSWFHAPNNPCPDCGAEMLPVKNGTWRDKKMLRCVYYPKCRGGKHKAKHVIAVDKPTRKARRDLHALLGKQMKPKKLEKWLSVYGTHAHIGQMMYDDIIETHVRYEQWRADELRVYIFNQLFKHI